MLTDHMTKDGGRGGGFVISPIEDIDPPQILPRDLAQHCVILLQQLSFLIAQHRMQSLSDPLSLIPYPPLEEIGMAPSPQQHKSINVLDKFI